MIYLQLKLLLLQRIKGLESMSKQGWSRFLMLIKKSVTDFLDDNAMKFSAALSYYTLFALPPLIILLIYGGGLFIDRQQIMQFFFERIGEFVGENTVRDLQGILTNVKMPKKGYLASIIGGGMLLFSASGVFAEIQSSINYIWGFIAKPEKSLMRFLKNRLLAFLMIGSVGAVVIASLFLTSVISTLSEYLVYFFEENTLEVVYGLNNLLFFLLVILMFALIFKTLPNGIIGWKETFVGALFTAVLFMIGKFGIGIYLSTAATSSIYGAAGSIVILLVWVYYSAMILYFGAEFTKNYAILYGKPIKPGPYSVEIEKFLIQGKSASGADLK